MIPLYKPFMPELPEMNTILQSGMLAYGNYTKKFEDNLRKYIGTSNVMVTCSFNMAISVVVSLLDLHEGDEIIVSPMACLASTQPYASHNLKIVWADINPLTGTLDPESVKQNITSKTKVILHNHFCGYVGDIDEINRIGKEYGITVIDDGIEGFGSKYKGNKLGVTGSDITVFSFNPVRIPNTIDGGAIVIRNDDLFNKALLIRDCGIERKDFRDDIGEINPRCDVILPGYSATMSNVNGYIGLQQMNHLEELFQMQKKNAAAWKNIFKNKDKVELLDEANTQPNYWVYGTLAKNKRNFILEMRENGFYASGVHIDNSRYSVFHDKRLLKGVTYFYEHFVALPSGWWVHEDEIRNAI